MDYALLKELKEAGFKAKCTHTQAWCIDNDALHDYTKCDEIISPTLSELIEAVKKVRLRITLKGFEDHWNAHCSTTESRSGSTPEEAVARLWLAINKK